MHKLAQVFAKKYQLRHSRRLQFVPTFINDDVSIRRLTTFFPTKPLCLVPLETLWQHGLGPGIACSPYATSAEGNYQRQCMAKLFYQTYDLMQIVLPRAVLRMRVASYDVT